MATYYLIHNDQLINEFDMDDTAVTGLSLSLLGGGETISLMNAQHAQNLMTNLSLTPAEALAALGIVDMRSSVVKTVFVGPDPAGSSHIVGGLVAYPLITIGDYGLWQVDGIPDDLLRLHALLWQMEPAQTIGMLAVVQVFGDRFYDSAVRTYAGMTIAQVLARRDQIAAYLESLGHTNTAALRTATTEDAQMVGIVTALGYTEAQMWEAMVD